MKGLGPHGQDQAVRSDGATSWAWETGRPMGSASKTYTGSLSARDWDPSEAAPASTRLRRPEIPTRRQHRPGAADSHEARAGAGCRADGGGGPRGRARGRGGPVRWRPRADPGPGPRPAFAARSRPGPPLGRFRFRFPAALDEENESGRGQHREAAGWARGAERGGGRPGAAEPSSRGAGSREQGRSPRPAGWQHLLGFSELQAVLRLDCREWRKWSPFWRRETQPPAMGLKMIPTYLNGHSENQCDDASCVGPGSEWNLGERQLRCTEWCGEWTGQQNELHSTWTSLE
ncbi:5E5 antigen-like isoform X3 [Equus przewalskii]|uniref:5E5 antigen-like isoform X3 n=1 Tax=Equus przewalskii TaxID=9798 RepID=A0ABM4KG90_EQUPR